MLIDSLYHSAASCVLVSFSFIHYYLYQCASKTGLQVRGLIIIMREFVVLTTSLHARMLSWLGYQCYGYGEGYDCVMIVAMKVVMRLLKSPHTY